MPSLQHMAGTHDGRVQYLIELARRHGWPVTEVNSYEHHIDARARSVLWSQQNMASHEIRNRPDLLFAAPDVEPFYLDVKTTTFRQDTGMVSVELYPAYRAWRDWCGSVFCYFDLDGWLLRADHLRTLIHRILIPLRWPDGSPALELYTRLAAELRPDLTPQRLKVHSQNASGDPFVLLPRDALAGRTRPWCSRTDDFIKRLAPYRDPKLTWPVDAISIAEMVQEGSGWTLEQAAYALDITVAELRPWWESRQRAQAARPAPKTSRPVGPRQVPQDGLF